MATSKFPVLMVRLPNMPVFDALSLMVLPEPWSIMTPPVPANAFGNSLLVVDLVQVPLYWRVDAAPKVGEAEMVAVPSMESTPFTNGTLVIVFAPELARVRL